MLTLIVSHHVYQPRLWSRPHSTVRTQSKSCARWIVGVLPTPRARSWGRVLAAMGTVNLSKAIIPERVSVSFVPADGSALLAVLVNGEPENVDEVRAKEILSNEDFEIKVELGLGNESAKYWTCDFSYVRITCACLSATISNAPLSIGLHQDKRGL